MKSFAIVVAAILTVGCEAHRPPLTVDNDEQAVAFEQLSARCHGADLESCTALGQMYEHGLAVPIHPSRALALYMGACAGGSAAGCTELGKAYLAGLAGPDHESRGVALLSSACFDGNPSACGELRAICRDPRGESACALVLEDGSQAHVRRP
jgi:TPR repeat protein